MLKLTYITTHIRLPATGCSLVGVVDDKGVQKIGSLYNCIFNLLFSYLTIENMKYNRVN